MKFAKILVVDDEAIQREVLAEIVKQISPDTEVFTVHNGQEAYDLMKKIKIELLLTDINMPVLNGIKLCEKVYRDFPEVKIVLISAYQEFEYARSAIRLGVSEYLLKPFRKKDVEQVMRKIWGELEKEREERNRLCHYEAMVKRQKDEIKKQQLKKILCGCMELGEINTELKQLLRGSGRVIALRWKISDGKYNRRYCAQITERQQERLLQQLSTAFSNGIWVMQEQGLDARERKALLVIPEEDRIEEISRIEQWIEELSKKGIIFWMGISNRKENLFLELQKAVEQAEEALMFYFYNPNKGKAFFYEKTRHALEKPLGSLVSYEKKLKNAVCSGKKEIQKDILFKMKQEFQVGDLYYPNRLKYRVSSLMLAVCKELEGMVSQQDYETFLNEVYEKFGICDSFEQLFHLSEEILQKVTDTFLNSSKEFDAVEVCISYIKEHLQEELSLQNLAEMVHFHPTYLSARIKERVGMSYSNFLLFVRMQEACQKLIETDCKVGNIAADCGFKDSSYFNRVFKREYKMSPEQYRKVHKSC